MSVRVCSQTRVHQSSFFSYAAAAAFCSASIIGFSSSFFSSLKSLIVPLNMSIPSDSTTNPASCSHDHFVRPSPNLRLSACRLPYAGQKQWISTVVTHTRNVRTGSIRFRTSELVYCVTPLLLPYQRHSHRAQIEDQQHHHGQHVQRQHRHAVLATLALSPCSYHIIRLSMKSSCRPWPSSPGRMLAIGSATQAVSRKPQTPSMPTTIVAGASMPCRRCSSAVREDG